MRYRDIICRMRSRDSIGLLITTGKILFKGFQPSGIAKTEALSRLRAKIESLSSYLVQMHQTSTSMEACRKLALLMDVSGLSQNK